MENLSYENLRKQLEEEEKRHKEKLKEIERKMKNKKRFYQPEIKNANIDENAEEIFTNTTGVYFYPRQKKKKSKIKRFFRKIKNFFRGIDERFIIEEYENNPINNDRKVPQPKYSMLIEYAQKTRKDKEKRYKLQQEYMNYEKTNHKKRRPIEIIEKELWVVKHDIVLAERLLKIEIKKIEESNLTTIEKNEIINKICIIADIKMNNEQTKSAHISTKTKPAHMSTNPKTKPAHMKKNRPMHMKTKAEPTHMKEQTTQTTVYTLKKEHQKIHTSKHLTIEEKKKMLKELKEELLNMTLTNSKQKTK